MAKFSAALRIFVIGVLGSLLLISLFSTQAISIDALDFSLGMEFFGSGQTVISIPPIGTISADTHQMPVTFKISLKNINIDKLSQWMSAQQPQEIFNEIQVTLRRQVAVLVVRLVAFAFIGGFSAGLLFYKSAKKGLLTAAAGLMAFILLVGIAAISYDDTAFQEPEFEGIIEAAPWLMGVAEEALVAVQGLDATLQVVTENLVVLFDSLRYVSTAGGSVDGDVKILHVSDLHNNPVGVSLAKQMALSFDVDFIVDTGDITDYGTPLEAELLSNIQEIGLPWVFVPGNHDSPAVVSAMETLDNVIVLENDIYYFDQLDIAIAGLADPAAGNTAMAVESKDAYTEPIQRLRQKIENHQPQPALIISHHIYGVEDFVDLNAVLLHGHSHRVDISAVYNAILIDAGTTGGAGLRGLMTPDELPYSMVLLHLDRADQQWLPVASDVITVTQFNAGFVLERHLLQPATLSGEHEALDDGTEESPDPGND